MSGERGALPLGFEGMAGAGGFLFQAFLLLLEKIKRLRVFKIYTTGAVLVLCLSSLKLKVSQGFIVK